MTLAEKLDALCEVADQSVTLSKHGKCKVLFTIGNHGVEGIADTVEDAIDKAVGKSLAHLAQREDAVFKSLQRIQKSGALLQGKEVAQ